MKTLSDKAFVLATDLDGTFLGGTHEDRRSLYEWIESNRATIGLVFVTGRDPAFIGELCASGVPWPEYVVGDVGTTIAEITQSREIAPIAALEAEISEAWGGSGERIRNALDGHPGLKLQNTAFRFRVSYDLDKEAFDHSAVDKVEAMGFDVLISDDRFFDVLPRGISKGPSLRRLVSYLGVAEDRVLAAGDTLNDLSMLALGLPAVAVGGSEVGLIERLRGLDHVHIAEPVGAAGILDAVEAFNLHPTP